MTVAFETTLESELQQHLDKLCVEIGPRPIGAAANNRAAEYITLKFREAGLEVIEQPFECPDWEALETSLELDGRRLPAFANTFSPGCEVTAPLVPLCSLAELRAANLTGRVALFYGELSHEPLTPKGFDLYNPERDREIVRLLEEKSPAALITVNLRQPHRERIIEDWNLAIPSATVPASAGLELMRQPGQTVHLKIVARREPGHSANLVGLKPGSRPERIVVCAHYDTKIETPGAWDNGSGMATLLALAPRLAGLDLPLGLELIAFSDEEYCGFCDTEYIRGRGAELGGILAVINLDGIGQLLGTHTVAIMANSEQFRQEVDRVMQNYPAVTWTEPWPQSNHSTFSWRGVPSIAVSSVGVTNIEHSPADTVELISPAKLAEVAWLVTEIVKALQDKPLGWTRPVVQPPQ